MKIGYPDKVVGHGITEPATKWFIVYTRSDKGQGTHICYEHLIAAISPEDAVYRLRENLKKIVEHVTNAATPEDKIEHVIYTDPDFYNMQRARSLREDIERLEEEIEQNTSDSELDNLYRESRFETIVTNREEIKRLEAPVEKGRTSKLLYRLEKVNEMLSDRMESTAHELSPDRAYSVAYFDDNRSVLKYCP